MLNANQMNTVKLATVAIGLAEKDAAEEEYNQGSF